MTGECSRLLQLCAMLLLLITVVQPAGAQPFIEGTHFWLEPAVFPGKTILQAHPQGPAKAKGVVIWNDGYSGDKIAPGKVPPIVQYFAEAGWDAYNLRRHSEFYAQRIALVMMVGVEKIKEKGYQRIVLMGQSGGAWGSIELGTYRTDILGILPLAPAGYGDYSHDGRWRQNDFEMRIKWDAYKGSAIRVAAGFFTDDDWYETKQPNIRGPFARQRLTELGIPNFIISQPDYPGMSTHFGGVGWEFARRYGPCLEIFFDTGKAPTCDDADPATAAVFKLPVVDVPSKRVRGFTGLWQGTIATGRLVRLIVPPVTEGRVDAYYQTGLGVDLDKQETNKWPLALRDGKLVREAGKFEFRLASDGDDRLRITYINHAAAQPAEAGFATLHRVVKP